MIYSLLELLEIPIKYSTATDYFYPNRINELKIYMQKLCAAKKEIVVLIKGKEVAIGSFNYHNEHFSKPFNFSNNGKSKWDAWALVWKDLLQCLVDSKLHIKSYIIQLYY